MAYLVEGLGEVHDENISLFAIFHVPGYVVHELERIKYLVFFGVLVVWEDVGFFQSLVVVLVYRDIVKIVVSMGATSVANSLRMCGLMVSVPAALYGFNARRSLVIPAVVMDI